MADLFEQAPTEFTTRSYMACVYGETGTGRTTLALSARGPIALFLGTEKIEGVVQKFSRSKDIRIHKFSHPMEGSKESVMRSARYHFDRFRAALVQSFDWAQTRIIDTDTDLWSLLRSAHFGYARPEKGRVEHNWEPVNAEWSDILSLCWTAKDKGLSTIFISRTDEEYTKPAQGQGQKTGRTIRKGQKSIPPSCDLIIRTHNDMDTKEIWSVVEKPWCNYGMLGEKFPGEISQMPIILAMLTDTTPDEWS